MKYFALGGNHLNQLNVAIDSGVQCQNSDISLDGRMSKSKVIAKHPQWKEGIDEGLRCTVLHKDLPKIYPTLCNLIQRSRNAVSQTHSPEAIIELILEIFKLAVETEKNNGTPDWEDIEKIVLQSEPPHPEIVPILCSWVMKYGVHSTIEF